MTTALASSIRIRIFIVVDQVSNLLPNTFILVNFYQTIFILVLNFLSDLWETSKLDILNSLSRQFVVYLDIFFLCLLCLREYALRWGRWSNHAISRRDYVSRAATTWRWFITKLLFSHTFVEIDDQGFSVVLFKLLKVIAQSSIKRDFRRCIAMMIIKDFIRRCWERRRRAML